MINKRDDMTISGRLAVCRAQGKGNRRAISRSNNRKVMATRKILWRRGRGRGI